MAYVNANTAETAIVPTAIATTIAVIQLNVAKATPHVEKP